MLRTKFSRLFGTSLLSLALLIGTARPAAAADYVVSYVNPSASAWSFQHSYSGSCYLGNGVRWTFTARWYFGYTARTSVRVNKVQVSYYMSQGGSVGGAWLQNSDGVTVWESGYNNRSVPYGGTYTQTFDLGYKVVKQGPNGIHFHVGTKPGNCGGALVNANFYIRST